MLKILTSQQTKELDAYTIATEPVKSIDLMERACEAFVEWFMKEFASPRKIGIICGTGNNGGDGLAIARLLSEVNYPVKVWIVRGAASTTKDFEVNFERVKGKLELFDIVSTSDQGLFSDRDILIDSIFGSGLSRPAEGIYEQAINCINQTKAIKIAVDLPSGLMSNGASTGKVVKADHTISFQLPKLAFLLPENYAYVGSWKIVDIGLSKTFLKKMETSYFYLNKSSVSSKIRKREKFDHKGTYGHALLIAGSYGKMGACVLSARACLRSGVGLVTTHVPKSGYVIIQTSVPEAMASIYEEGDFFSSELEAKNYQAIGVGPGLGQSKETSHALLKLLQLGKPLVIDADGLNILAANPDEVNRIPPGSILTPHPKEFERIVGPWKNDFDRLEKQKKLAVDTRSIVILKGAHSSIAAPDSNVYFNSTGNPGMATGGSGDVLTGILTGLLAQGYTAVDAAIVGVYLHGLSGDLAAREKGQHSLIASDLIEFLAAAFKSASS